MAQQTYTSHGTVHDILPEEIVGTWKKRILILEVEGYKGMEHAAFEFFGEKNVEKLDRVRAGETAEIDWQLKGKVKAGGKCYTTLSAFKITTKGSGAPDRGFSRPERHDDRRDRQRDADDLREQVGGRNPRDAERDIDF